MAHILCYTLVDVKIIFGRNNKNKVLDQNSVCEGKCVSVWFFDVGNFGMFFPFLAMRCVWRWHTVPQDLSWNFIFLNRFKFPPSSVSLDFVEGDLLFNFQDPRSTNNCSNSTSEFQILNSVSRQVATQNPISISFFSPKKFEKIAILIMSATNVKI